MDFLTQQFIATAHRLRRELRELIERISVLNQRLQEQSRAIHNAQEAHNQAHHTPPVLSAVLQVPDPIKVKTEPKAKEKDRYQQFVDTGTLVFVAAYT
ncbi:MAG TPA: hypothetical protein VGL74_07705, partial [Terriglobales bacterium]